MEGWLNGISGIELVFVKSFHGAKANDGHAIVKCLCQVYVMADNVRPTFKSPELKFSFLSMERLFTSIPDICHFFSMYSP